MILFYILIFGLDFIKIPDISIKIWCSLELSIASTLFIALEIPKSDL